MSDPASIHLDDLKKSLRDLGIDPTDLISATLGPDSVTVVRKRRNEDGHYFGAGNEVAKVTTTIGIAGRPA